MQTPDTQVPGQGFDKIRTRERLSIFANRAQEIKTPDGFALFGIVDNILHNLDHYDQTQFEAALDPLKKLALGIMASADPRSDIFKLAFEARNGQLD